MEVGTVHYDSEFDVKWVNLVDGVETNRVKVNGEKILVFTESHDFIQDKQFNPNDDFDLLEIEFLLDDKEAWRINEDTLTDQLYTLFQGEHKYSEIYIPKDTPVKLTLGYDAETWEPKVMFASIESAKEFILQHFKLEIEDNEWYWLEAKSE
jgi:hypothetical protein